MPTLGERFWQKVRKTETCWLWTAQLSTNGYGQMRVKRNGVWTYDRSHRISWEIHFGSAPDGLCVLHRCDIRSCVNPSHLWLGTYGDNIRDMYAKHRSVHHVNPQAIARGERNGWSALTADAVRDIRSRYVAGGVTMATLGDDYGVTKHAVFAILHGRTWRHVQ